MNPITLETFTTTSSTIKVLFADCKGCPALAHNRDLASGQAVLPIGVAMLAVPTEFADFVGDQ